MKKLVELVGVTKEYGEEGNIQKAVNDVSFTIDEGEFVVILGQSGAGKSTVLNMIGGMDFPTSGKVIVDGKEISALKDKELTDYRAKTTGYIFQFYNLIPTLTALENVSLMKTICKDAEDPMEMLKIVGLETHCNKFPTQMSGGEQQRVSIARALSKKPKILLGDEPTGALDTETGVAVISLLQKLCNEEKKTVIIVTHNPAYAECANKVIKMKNGKVVECYTNEMPKDINEVEC